MGRNQKTRRKIEGNQRILEEHKLKIKAELEKPNPNYDLIRKWLKDIKVFEENIRKLEQRLPGRKK